MLLVFLAPLFMGFDIGQLLLAERFIGVKQIRKGEHPLDADRRLPDWASGLWVIGLGIYWAYMALLAFHPNTALQGILMIGITLAGFAVRRVSGLKWALVFLTLETAIRLGLLANILIVVFLFEGRMLPPGYYR